MKTLFFFGILVNAALASQAQTALSDKNVRQEATTSSGIQFEKLTHDFGKLEQGKPASVRFVFTNTSGKPITLTQVQSSCGCTTSDYSRELIMPGKSGFIVATYNAASRGTFSKTVNVATSLGGEPILLQIKGTVGE